MKARRLILAATMVFLAFSGVRSFAQNGDAIRRHRKTSAPNIHGKKKISAAKKKSASAKASSAAKTADATAPKTTAPKPQPLHLVNPNMERGVLLNKVVPVYPEEARKARVQGAVVLHVIIGKDGAIKSLKVVSGHPLLCAAAIDAVKQWIYKPYLVNGEPVEVDTVITLNFTLASD